MLTMMWMIGVMVILFVSMMMSRPDTVEKAFNFRNFFLVIRDKKFEQNKENCIEKEKKAIPEKRRDVQGE